MNSTLTSKNKKLMQSVFTDYNGIKLEIDNKVIWKNPPMFGN